MTDVTRRVRRRTAASMFSRGKRREVILIVEPPGTVLRFRLAGERRTFSLSTATAYALAVRAEAESRKAAKLAARKARKAARS